MVSIEKSARLSFGLGIVSLASIVAGHLALTDIRHGGEDLSLEWRFLQGAFALILMFHAAALVTLGRLLRRETGADRRAG